MIKILSYSIMFVVLMSGILLVAADNVSGEINTVDRSRPELPEGEPHTDTIVHSIEPKAGVFAATLSETKILIVTSGHGPLTGISPQDEKDYWKDLLEEMGYASVDWYDGIPTFDLLNQHDLVIYDAGGYWYPLSNEVEPLWDYHFAGKPLIIVAPDVNYDWENIKDSPKPTFCEDVAHINGVLGVMPEIGFEVIANTGHEIIVSVPTGVEIPVASNSSWPDCFDPASDCAGVLTQGYIDETEFGMGSCSDLPSYEPYDPEGNLFSVVAYSGSESEGRTVLYGFPPTAMQDSAILDTLARSTISWALGAKKIPITLYTEDAPSGVKVNKAPGDIIYIVEVIENQESSSQDVDVRLEIPSDLFGNPNNVFLRDSFTDTSESNTITWTEPANGKYSISVNLPPNAEQQIVWSFAIPETVSAQNNFKLTGKTYANGLVISSDDALINVVSSRA